MLENCCDPCVETGRDYPDKKKSWGAYRASLDRDLQEFLSWGVECENLSGKHSKFVNTCNFFWVIAFLDEYASRAVVKVAS